MNTTEMYVKSQTQPVIDKLASNTMTGLRGSIVLAANGRKTKCLSIGVEQARYVQRILNGLKVHSGEEVSSAKYERDELNRIIADFEYIAADGYNGTLVLEADGVKTKHLAIDLTQAKSIRNMMCDAF
jgi:hypothetical protein